MNRQYEGFDGWSAVQREFSADLGPEPTFVFANYEQEGYEGSAIVVTADAPEGPYRIVIGSHCSCMGLEDQWEPTEHGRKDLLRSIPTYRDGGATAWAAEVFGLATESI